MAKYLFQKLGLVLLLLTVIAILSEASPLPDDPANLQTNVVRQTRAKRARGDTPSRKQTEYEIGILRGYLNNADLYFCRGDPYDGIQCPEEPRCSTWEGVCDGKQVCAIKQREACLNRTRESYGFTDERLCNGDENTKWCYWKNLAPQRCGEDIFLDPTKKRRFANIRSPGYPQRYPSDLFCFWTVSVPRGRKLSVRIRRFESEANYDYMSIGHGTVRDDPRDTVIFKHSGDKLPAQREFNSKGSSIWITFRADDWDSKSGFAIRVQDTQEYDAGVVGQNPFNAEPNRDCGSTMFLESGDSLTLTSPKYPNFYDNYIECEWIVSTNRGRLLKITFPDFDTEDGEDFLSVGNGISTRRAPIMYKYSGGEAPKKILARGSDVWFKFTSSLAIARKGFKAIITERPISECGGNYIVPSDGSLHVTSPYYPGSYPSNAHCTWSFRLQTQERGMYFIFKSFQSEPIYDRMSVGTGMTPEVNQTNAIIYKHSGFGLPEWSEFLLREQTAWITLDTDDMSDYRGFSLEIWDESVAPRTAEEMIVFVEEEEEIPTEAPEEEEEEEVVEEEVPAPVDENINVEEDATVHESSYFGSSESSSSSSG